MPGQTLAQAVRAKYPGAYDHVTDVALESAIDAKYPGAYDHVPRTPPRAPASRAAVLPPALREGGRIVEPSSGGAPAHDLTTFEGYYRAMHDPGMNRELERSQADAVVQNYIEPGPGRVIQGVREIGRGQIAKGGRDVIAGALTTIAPAAVAVAPEALMVAPLATTAAVTTGAVVAPATQAAVEATGSAVGLSDDQAGLAGDLAGLAAGGYAATLAGTVVPRAAAAWQAARVTARGQRATHALRRLLPTVEPKDLDVAVPWLQASKASMAEPSVVAGRDALDEVIQSAEAHVQAAIQRVPHHPIGVDPLVETQAALAKSPQASFLTRGFRDILRSYPQLTKGGDLTLAEADIIRNDLNALNRALLQRTSYKQADARKASPIFAAREAVVRALRDGIYGTLDAKGMPGFDALRRDMGSLMKVRDAFEAARTAADLKTVAGTRTAGPIRRGAAEVLKWSPIPAHVTNPAAAALKGGKLTRDELFAQAMDLLTPAEAPALPAITTPQPVAGLLPRGAVPLRAPVDPVASDATPVMPAAMLRVDRGQPKLPAPQATPMPPGPDPSTVRSVPAVDVALTGRRALPPGRTTRPMPVGILENDPSFVRSVPAEYGVRVEPTTTGATPSRAARKTGKKQEKKR